jgi:MtfA peptidase
MSYILLLVVVAVGIVVFGNEFRKARKREQDRTAALERQFHEEIGKYSHYYKLLDDFERELFLRRAWIFFSNKEFEARGFDAVSLRMRAIVSAYAAQITFGLPEIHLRAFHTIVVYPAPYYSEKTGSYHKGETRTSGFIVFSWKDLTEGHNDPEDGINLALHELAHALRVENVTIDNEVDFLDAEALRHFTRLSLDEMERIRQEEQHFLREYAATNHQEFFAVCVENFFERPEPFLFHHPELYMVMTKILLQDPLKRQERYLAEG